MELVVKNITIFVSLILEAGAAIIIAIALLKLGRDYFNKFYRSSNRFSLINARAGFGISIAVSLELLLGADVLETAVAPDWNDIGQLAAIATIRTVLNFFLEKELRPSKSGV